MLEIQGVRQMLAIKIFSILVNLMPDERTGSKITWFNSPLCANQDVLTLVNMIQVGQWYEVYKVHGEVINNIYHYAHSLVCHRRAPAIKQSVDLLSNFRTLRRILGPNY